MAWRFSPGRVLTGPRDDLGTSGDRGSVRQPKHRELLLPAQPFESRPAARSEQAEGNAPGRNELVELMTRLPQRTLGTLAGVGRWSAIVDMAHEQGKLAAGRGVGSGHFELTS